jgi:hypothetical protein
MNEIILNSNTHVGLLITAESEQAVLCPDVARWVSSTRPSGGNTAAASLLAGLQPMQPESV